MRQSLNKSLLFKIIALFMCVLLPTYACILFFFYRTGEIIRRNIFEFTQRQAQYELSSLHSVFQQISALQHEYINDLELYSVALGSQFFSEQEVQRAIVRLQTRLSSSLASTPMAEETYVYIFSLKMLVSATLKSTTDLPFSIDNLLNDRPLLQNQPQLIHSEDAFYLVTVSPKVSVNAKPFFVVYTKVSTKNVADLLDATQFSKDTKLLLLNEELELLGTTTNITDQETQHYFSMIGEGRIARTGSFLVDDLLIVSQRTEAPDISLVVLYPEHIAMQEFFQMRNLIVFILIFITVLAFLFAFGIYYIVYKPLSVLKQAFLDVESGKDNVHIVYRTRDEFCDIYDRFNNMVARLHVLIGRIYQQEIENKRSELKQLQSQINPHFLYNCFFIIYRLSKLEDMDTLSEFSRHMGEYFQYVTRNKNDVVRLKDEVKHAQDYVHIQDIRFSNRIDVNFGVLSERYADLLVPRFILQPILENCYEHGFKHSAEGGHIEVQYVEAKGELLIVVSNSGDNISQQKCDELREIMLAEETSAECTGIINVSRRLKLMYRQNDLLRIRPGDVRGVVVTIRIPGGDIDA